MIHNLRKKYRRLFLMSGVILSLLLSGIAVGMIVTDMKGLSSYEVYAKDDDTDNDEDADEISFYGAASSGAEAYDIMADDAKKGNGGENRLDLGTNVGRAAAVMGYLDSDRNNPIEWITTKISMSQRATGYGQVATGSDAQTVQGYLLYGRLWNMYGIDETGSENKFAIFRPIAGNLLWLFYQLSNIVSFLFDHILSFIQFMNPFRFIYGSGATGSGMLDATMNEVGMQSGIADYFGTLGETISDIYVALNNIGVFVTVPLLLLSIALTVTLYNDQNRNGRIKGAVIKILIIVLGVPFLGMFYTQSIDLMHDMIEGDNIGASFVVANTLVDFESWARDTNLAYPSEIKTNMVVTDASSGSNYANSSTSPRKAAQLINTKAGLLTGYGSTNIDTEADFNQNLYKEVSKEEKTVNSQMVDLIDRYKNSGFYHASDYEADVKSEITSKEEVELLSELQDPETWPEEITTNRFTNDGGLSVSYNRMDGRSNPNYQVTYVQDGNLGLSTLGMYNYLNTAFDETSAVIYSAEKTVSGSVAKYHYSVSLIGNGMSEYLYMLNALVMMMFIAVIGCVYALGLLVGIFRRTVRMFIAIMGSAVGMMTQMAQLVSIVLMAVFEIVATIFIYTIVVELIVGTSTILTDVLYGNGIGTVFAASGMHIQAASIGTFGDSMVALFNTIFVAWMTFQALKLRKQLIHNADSMMAQSFERLFGVGGRTSGGRSGNPVQNNSSRSNSQTNGGLSIISAGAGIASGARAINSLTGGDAKDGAGNAGATAAAANEAGESDKLMDAVGVNGARNAGSPPGVPEEASVRPGLGGNGVLGIDAQGNGGGQAYNEELGVDGNSSTEALSYSSLAEASMVPDSGSGIDSGNESPALSKTEQMKKDLHDTIRHGTSEKARDIAAEGISLVHPVAGAAVKSSLAVQKSLASGQSVTSAAKAGAVSGINSAISSKTGNAGSIAGSTGAAASKMAGSAKVGTVSAKTISAQGGSRMVGTGKTISTNTPNMRNGALPQQKIQSSVRTQTVKNSHQTGNTFRPSSPANDTGPRPGPNRTSVGQTIPRPQTDRIATVPQRQPAPSVNTQRVINNQALQPRRTRQAQGPAPVQKARLTTAEMARQDKRIKK